MDRSLTEPNRAFADNLERINRTLGIASHRLDWVSSANVKESATNTYIEGMPRVDSDPFTAELIMERFLDPGRWIAYAQITHQVRSFYAPAIFDALLIMGVLIEWDAFTDGVWVPQDSRRSVLWDNTDGVRTIIKTSVAAIQIYSEVPIRVRVGALAYGVVGPAARVDYYLYGATLVVYPG